MTAGIKANVDGSGAIQVGGTDYITISSAGAVSIPQTLAVTGATTFAAGSASTPSIAFTGDTNTGIYSPGADRIGFAEGGTQVGEFDASGNFQFNSGYGSVATAYGCRAWVDFNGTASGTFAGGVSTVTRISGSTTATVTTTTAHGLITGNQVYALTGVAAGVYVVTVISTTQFSFTTVATTALTAASITFAVNSIKASGNVSSVADNAAGDYTVNFAIAMPDANYGFALSCQGAGYGNTFIGVEQNSFTTPTTSAFRLLVKQGSTLLDRDYVCASFFR